MYIITRYILKKQLFKHRHFYFRTLKKLYSANICRMIAFSFSLGLQKVYPLSIIQQFARWKCCPRHQLLQMDKLQQPVYFIQYTEGLIIQLGDMGRELIPNIYRYLDSIQVTRNVLVTICCITEL